MKHKQTITILVSIIAIAAILATGYAIVSHGGDNGDVYRSIRGEDIPIQGTGLYKHMSVDVAIQGIAQDYITLIIGVPMLLIGLYGSRKGNIRALFVLAGTLSYFLLTYLFYTAMAMFNELFLLYVVLLCCSFFAFLLTLSSFDIASWEKSYASTKPFRNAGIFIVINCSLIALLWLSALLPPLFDGSIYPAGLQHYTTLIVQGFDLGLFLPIGFVSGIMAIRRHPSGYFFTMIYVLFLSLLMASLTAKILFMAYAGYAVVPAIFIMPTILLVALVFSGVLLTNIKAAK